MRKHMWKGFCFMIHLQVIGRVSVGTVTSTETYSGKRDTIYLLLSQIILFWRVVSRLTQTTKQLLNYLTTMCISYTTIRHSEYKSSLHWIQLSQKLPRTKSLDMDINTFSYLLLLTLVFRCNQLRKVKVKVKSMTRKLTQPQNTCLHQI